MKNKHEIRWLLVLLGGSAFLAWVNFDGIVLSDEYLYTERAWNILQGKFTLTSSAFDNRFGWLWLQTLSIQLIGTSTIGLTLPSVLSILSLVFITWKIARTFNPKIGLVAATLVGLNPAILKLAGDVSPDLLMAAFATVGVYFIWKKSNWAGVWSSLFLFAAFCTKLSVLFLAPWVLFLFIIDIRQQKAFQFWMIFSLSSFTFFCIYFIVYFHLTGDPLYRWHGIEQEHNISEWSYYGKPFAERLKRISIYLPIFFIGSGVIGSFLPLSFFVLQKNSDKKWKNKKEHFWFIYLAFLLVIHAFGSTSFSYYNPILLYDRMWLLLVPPLAICSAFYLDQPSVRFPRIQTVILFGLIFSGLIGQYFLHDRFLYFWLTSCVSAWVLAKPFIKKYWLIGLFSLLFLPQILNIYNFRNDDFFRESAFLQSLNTEKKILILTDSILTSKPLVHLGFKEFPQLELQNWHYWKTDSNLDYDQIWILFDPKREAIMNDYFHRPVPDYIKLLLPELVNKLQIIPLEIEEDQFDH